MGFRNACEGRCVVIIRVIDFETTGFPPSAGVCEAGWTDVTVDADGVTIGETVAHLCNPGMPISAEASRVNGITDAMVAGEPAASTIFRMMMEGADAFCAHNCEFERAFFGGGDLPWICTYKVALALYPDLPSHKNSEVPKALGLRLDADRCEPLHRAGPDTYVTAVTLAYLIMKGAMSSGDALKQAAEFIAITKRPREIIRMPFGKHKGEPIAQLPRDYLEWAVAKMNAADVREACRRELEKRRQPDDGDPDAPPYDVNEVLP